MVQKVNEKWFNRKNKDNDDDETDSEPTKPVENKKPVTFLELADSILKIAFK